MARLFIVIPGSIGLLLVGRAITLYSRQDRLAFGLSILIGVGLLAGLVELALRLRRADALRKEVEALPSPATEETVTQTSPLLGAWLRAAIAQVSPPPALVPVTPYLLGLLVMMGLLGTFLGLFETLQSARAVLTSTAGDVELLRTGMAAPMIGLSRAFGTSAAGVSASASLGLAAVFVRRVEAQAAAAVAAYIAGPLRGLTPEVRKVVVMERLAQECEALPKAAMALHEAVSRLSGLEQTMAAAQEKAAEQTAQAMAQTALALREELARTAGASAAAVASVMEPRLDAMTRAVAVAMGGEVQRFLASQESKLVQMDQWLEARHESDGRHASQLAALVEAQRQGEVAAAERLEALAEARRVSDLTHAKALTEALEASLQREQARWEAASERDEAARRSQNERDEARRLAQAQVEASQRQEHERHMAELLGEQRSQWNAMVAKFDELTMAREREEVALSEKLAALGQARKDSDLAFESQLARMVETRQQQELAFEERLRALDNQLQSASQQELERLSQLGERLVEGAAVGAVRVKELLERMASEAEKQWAVHGEEHRARSEELKATLDAFARAADQVQASAQARADEVIAAVSGHAESAAGATAAQVRALGEALTVHAEGLATAAQEQIRTLNEAVQAGVERMAAASNAATVDLLAAARENTEAMAERMVALEGRVDESRVAAADLLAGKLADHAKGVGDELTAIVASLVEATDLVKAGGAEMQAVAEMFLGAVDKYREANDQWMETLGKIEDTLAKEAREEAGDLLGDYIEQSRELFDQSLQFQRELFSEFRALRQSRDSMVVPAAGE